MENRIFKDLLTGSKMQYELWFLIVTPFCLGDIQECERRESSQCAGMAIKEEGPGRILPNYFLSQCLKKLAG